MDTSILCPHCGKSVEITSALSASVEESIKKKYEKQFESQLDEKNKKIQNLQNEELELRKRQRSLEEKEKEQDLIIARKLDEQRKIAEEVAGKRASELYHLKEAEKDKIINDLKTALEDAQRKATQGSQQLQGEVQELDLEHLLHDAFHDDDIQAIGKGVLGADIRQIVKTSRGTECGSILWESKRTKSWSGEWLTKLKQDTLRDKADLSAIVSEVLPSSIDKIGQIDGVHICLPVLVLPMAALLRKILIDVARQKFFSDQKQDKAGQIYAYVTGTEFSQTVESLISTYQEMQEQLIQERTAFERIWKRREAQIQSLISGVGGIYGHLQGVAGPALPAVKGLQLPEGD